LILTARGKWLNDRLINFFFRILEFSPRHDRSSLDSSEYLPSDILLMDPSVVSFLRIQCQDEDDFASLSRGQRLLSRRLVLMPCSDSTDFESASTHWSLVIIDTQLQTASHMDSNRGMNHKSARHLVKKFEILMRCELQYQLLTRIHHCSLL
jgi:hypothetical protein